MKIIECQQGTPEWWAAKAGIPSASNANRIITPAKGELSKQCDAFIDELIAQRIMGATPSDVEAYTSRAMQDGIDMEPRARRAYEFDRDVDVEQVGFVTDDSGRFGCSPDGLVRREGGLEIKVPKLSTHIGYVRGGVLPTEYRVQVHTSLFVTKYNWWDFMSYAHWGIPSFIIRVEPDDFTKRVGEALIEFDKKYRKALEPFLPYIEAPVAEDKDQPF